MQPNEVMQALDAKLKAIAPGLGWDNAGAFRMARDPSGKIRLSYLNGQGSFLVHNDDATAYLEWLEAGNTGTIIKWAKEKGRRLK